MAAFIDHRSGPLTDVLSVPPSSKLSYLFYPAAAVILLLSGYRFILKDYHDFLALGPGGTPSTFAGYLKVTYLRLFTIKDPFQPPSLAQTTYPTNCYLRHLPRRASPRPITAGIAPHRQLNQKCSAHLQHALRAALHSLAAAYPSLIRKGTSCFEKRGLALFLSASTQSVPPDLLKPPAPSHLNPTCANTGEICHLHATVRHTSRCPLYVFDFLPAKPSGNCRPRCI